MPEATTPGLPVALQKRSRNPKLAPVRSEPTTSRKDRYIPIGPYVSSTYVSMAATCPDDCVFRNAGCFAEAGGPRLTNRLNKAAAGMTPLEVTLAEADLIDGTFRRLVPQDGAKGGRDLRLHVGGDVSCAAGADALAGAADRWRSRRGGLVWSYTHRWLSIPRSAWGSISVLASVEDGHDAEDARRMGYAVAVVVRQFPSGPERFTLPGTDLQVIPCPAESMGKTCAQCRLCLDDEQLRGRNTAIGFAVHGRDAQRARQHLPVLPG